MKKILMPILLVLAITSCGGSSAKGKAKDDLVSLVINAEFTTAWVRNFNPFLPVLSTTNGFVNDYLVIFNPMDNMSEIPWLATEIISHDDLRTITVKLRENVFWSDGTPFTAEDVAFTWEYTRGKPEIGGDTNWGEDGRFEKISVIDELTVEFVLREPNAFARSEIFNHAIIHPKHIWEGVENPTQVVVEDPVGTGPFTEVVNFTPQIHVMGRNPYFWGNDQLAIDQIVFPQFNSNESAYEALKNGEIDWGSTFIPDVETIYVAGNPDNKYWFPSGDGVRITVNHLVEDEALREAFGNIHFRQAFSLAMDRQTMMDVGAFGYVKGGNPASNLPPSLWGWRNPQADEIWADFYRYDLDAAREQLYELGGFGDSDNDGWVETPSGLPFAFDIQVPSGWTDWINNVQIAVEGLREIGINANIVTPETGTYSANWENGNFQAQMVAGSLRPNIWGFYDYTMHSKNIQRAGLWWSTNVHNFGSEELDNLIDSLPLAVTEEEQKAITDQIELIYAQNVAHIPLYYNGVWYEYNTARFEGWANESNPFIHPAPWQHDSKLYHIMQLRPKGQ